MTLEPNVRDLLSRPNFAHLATLMPDGSPSVTPTWIGLSGDRIVITSGESTLKVRNLRRDPRLALSVVDYHNPYEEVQIRGRVVEFRDDSGFEMVDDVSRKYTGKDFPWRDPAGRVALFVEIEQARYTKLPFEHSPAA